MLAALLFACAREPAHRPGPPPELPEPGDSGTLPPSADTAHTATPEVGPGCEPGARPTGGVQAGEDLLRLTFADSPARCNDGTPPVAWVRQGDPRRWVVHLRGGAACLDASACRDRWCGRGAYDAGNMSSAWAPPGIQAAGILDPAPDAPFHGWTVVEVHYCSSDNWLGAAPAVDLEGWTVGFEGYGIAQHVLDRLLVGATSDDGTQVLPPLADAATVVFSGSSAGGFGAAFHLEEVADRLPGAQVVGLVDSIVSLDASVLPEELRDDVYTVQHAFEGGIWNPVADPGCTEDCFDFLTWAETRRTRPVAWRHDLFDPVVGERFIPPLTADDYAAAGVAALDRLAALPGVGVLGTRCGRHMAAPGPAFSRERVSDPDHPWRALSLEDVLVSVLDGEPLSAIDDGAGAFSICPQP
jgi:hypothetical protein